MEGKFFLSKHLICVILLLGQLHGYKSCIERERKALFEVKKYIISITIKDGSDYVLSTWTYDTKSDCCRWEGVKCNPASKRVTDIAFGTLYLKENSLLNLSLLHPFEDVRCLNLSMNSFNGFFDDVEGYKSLGKLRNLEILDLSENHFNNSIFPFLSAATSLTTLTLRDNYLLNGSFPAKDVINLELRDLRRINLNGSLAVHDLSSLRMLKSLDLSGNLFSAPTELQGYKSLSRLRNLEFLDLSRNAFNNSIFPFLNAATSLKTLFLRSNNMGGPFPAAELKDLTNLELLNLSRNKFNGSIPIRVSLRKLKALDLSDNDFSASMGLLGICEMKNMQELDLSGNKLVGPFPSCLTGLTSLRVLDLSSNQLTGKVPSALGNLRSLEYLSLLDNNFEGLFSFGSLANLSKLSILKLSSKSSSLQVESKGSWKPKFQLNVIELPSCNLVKVPYFLLYQKDLSRIDLSDNKLVGDFPYWLLANNTKLKILSLQNNSFTSFQLPESAHNLLSLDVSANDFNRLRLPENIGWVLPHLRYLKLADNGFEGNLPPSVGNMKSIKYLDISHNNFHGELPRSFVMGCYSMIVLKLSHNNLSGGVFLESVNFTGIKELSMDNNLFTGTFGQGLRSLRSLRLLDISNNRLTGVIPSWIGEFSFLSALLLSNNSLEGEIPTSLFNLELLDLSANTLSGNLPPHVNVNSRDMALLLQDNNLSGIIPATLLTNVSLLDLRNNRLSGNIPEFTNTQSISTLLLRGNNLSGSIPHRLCGLSKIQHLDLSRNRLNGSIPSCFSNTSFELGEEYIEYGYRFDYYIGLEDFGRTEFQDKFKPLIELDPFSIVDTLTTQIKIEFATKHRYDAYVGGNLGLLFGMDLSENELSGDIPADLGGLLKLQALNLSHNKLSGLIPESFSGLKNVESLDLSFNRLQARIPSELAELSSLAVFNVSFNNLSGVIPQGRQFNTFDAKSYLGNPLLCGQSINISCDINAFQEPADSGVEADESIVDMVSFYWSLAAAYATILVGLFSSLSFDSPWRRYWFSIVDAFIHKAKSLLW